jgi:hypothetical protein
MSVIVVEFLDGLEGELVEGLVRAFGVEPHHPFGGRQLDLVDVTPGALSAEEFVLERRWSRQCVVLNRPGNPGGSYRTRAIQ